MSHSFASYTLIDHDGERSTVTLRSVPITAATIENVIDEYEDLRDAIDGMTLGNPSQWNVFVTRENMGSSTPADKNAQRETKWLVVYEDVTENISSDPVIANPGFRKRFTLELPTANLQLLRAGTKHADFEETAVATFVSEFEDVVISPYGGAVEVRDIIQVGRNL